MSKPVRIRLSRKKGFNLQKVSMELNGLPAVKCARPSRWGNPYRIGEVFNGIHISDNQMAVDYHRSLVDNGLMRIKIRNELRGKNLACYCKLSEPCHCDILLAISNASE